jgi:transcriptional regulator with XRE-family HTH domain
MAGKRHATEEISAKLAQANELAAKGKTQREISKALGVSIMTYHRWKKMMNVPVSDSAERYESRGKLDTQIDRSGRTDIDDELKRLELENTRLRRVVTDMLLEKLRLEDELRLQQEKPLGRPGKGK